MTEAIDQRDLLMRYLLGAASNEECAAVEEQCFADNEGIDLLLRAEDELIDDYVTGVLSMSDRRMFESHFLCTKKRRQRVEMVESLVVVLADRELAERPLFSGRLAQSWSVKDQAASDQPPAPSKQLAAVHAPAVFAHLLNWLDSDRDRAGEKYEAIRRGLIKMFASRGFDNAEDLADETFDRVAARSAQIFENYVGDPMRYFYGVARLVMHEAEKRQPAHDPVLAIVGKESASNETYSCLEKCLEHLSASNRDLIFQYYASEQKNKVDNRNALAQSFGMSPNALRLRVHKIRQALQNCITLCLQSESHQLDIHQ
jgi:DNA-directed RNA polymerase specialized sigma24 family protein